MLPAGPSAAPDLGFHPVPMAHAPEVSGSRRCALCQASVCVTDGATGWCSGVRGHSTAQWQIHIQLNVAQSRIMSAATQSHLAKCGMQPAACGCLGLVSDTCTARLPELSGCMAGVCLPTGCSTAENQNPKPQTLNETRQAGSMDVGRACQMLTALRGREAQDDVRPASPSHVQVQICSNQGLF